MREIYEILEALQATALTPEQSVLVKELANTCGSNAQRIKNEINALIDLEITGDTADISEIKAIILRAGNEF